MRNIAFDARELYAIVEALKLQISMMGQRRTALGDGEKNDDERSDLTNDLGFLEALTRHLQNEIQLELTNPSG